jgi:hypothetical protein
MCHSLLSEEINVVDGVVFDGGFRSPLLDVSWLVGVATEGVDDAGGIGVVPVFPPLSAPPSCSRWPSMRLTNCHSQEPDSSFVPWTRSGVVIGAEEVEEIGLETCVMLTRSSEVRHGAGSAFGPQHSCGITFDVTS